MTPSSIALKGQSLAEYTLVGGLLALVSIGGLIALNTSVGEQFTTMQGLFGGGGGQQGNQSPSIPAEAVINGGQDTTPPVTNGGSAYPINAAGFEQLMADMPQLIETSGANGATKVMMGYLSEVASQLEAAGEITPEHNGLLQELANAGHASAELQQALEQQMQLLDPNMRMEVAQHQQLTLNGTQKLLKDWSLELFQHNSNYSSMDSAAQSQMSGGAVSVELKEWREGLRPIDSLTRHNQFLARYMQVNDSGLLSNPTIATIVNKLATDVVNLNDRVNYVTRFNTDQAEALVKDSQSELNGQKLASALTHSKAEGICVTGGGTDSGIFCSE